MQYTYKPEGVCSYKMIIEVEEDTIKKVTIEGGCAGNTVGVSRLVEGKSVDEVIQMLKVSGLQIMLIQNIRSTVTVRCAVI